MLDEAMGWAAMFSGFYNVTAKMQVRYRKMARMDQSYNVSCTIVEKDFPSGSETEASMVTADGTVIAEASSTQFIVNAASPNQ